MCFGCQDVFFAKRVLTRYKVSHRVGVERCFSAVLLAGSQMQELGRSKQHAKANHLVQCGSVEPFRLMEKSKNATKV